MLRSRIRDAVLVGICGIACACASNTIAAPATSPAAASTLTFTVADVSFSYPDTMRAVASDVGTETPTAMLYGDHATGEVSVRLDTVDPKALRADAIARVEDRLTSEWPWRALNYTTMRVLHVAGRRAKGVRMVVAHDRELWVAHVYTTEVGSRTVLLTFVYRDADSPLYDDAVDDLIGSLAPDPA
jgi:hypothetical protein